MKGANLWLRRSATVVLVAAATFLVTDVFAFAVMAAVATSALPRAIRVRRTRISQQRLRSAWPAVIDEAVSAIRAGVPPDLALIEAMQHLPEPTASAARAFAADVRSTGRIDEAFVWFGEVVNDAVADRLIVVIRLVRRLGSPDAITMLEHVAESARDEQMLHESIDARRSWINASAIMATAAPWVIAVSLSSRESARSAYNSAFGAGALLLAAVCTAVAFLLMRRIGRVNEPVRLVMRP